MVAWFRGAECLFWCVRRAAIRLAGFFVSAERAALFCLREWALSEPKGRKTQLVYPAMVGLGGGRIAAQTARETFPAGPAFHTRRPPEANTSRALGSISRGARRRER